MDEPNYEGFADEQLGLPSVHGRKLSLGDCAQDVLKLLRSQYGLTASYTGNQVLDMRLPYLAAPAPRESWHGHAYSRNSSCVLLPTLDSSIALNCAREDDESLLAAWLQQPTLIGWDQVPEIVCTEQTNALVHRGRELGLPVAHLGPERQMQDWLAGCLLPTRIAPAASPLVVDLSALWAGPLCSHLLERMGMRVIKVESSTRQDPTQGHLPELYGQLHHNKEVQVLDFGSKADLEKLRKLLERADIVIEGSRPRALRQLGIDAWQLTKTHRTLWLSLTAYGRSEPHANWAGFGDDVAIAAGAISRSKGKPAFCCDAVADPLTGAHAALAIASCYADGHRGLLDVSLYGVTYCALRRGYQPDSSSRHVD